MKRQNHCRIGDKQDAIDKLPVVCLIGVVYDLQSDAQYDARGSLEGNRKSVKSGTGCV